MNRKVIPFLKKPGHCKAPLKARQKKAAERHPVLLQVWFICQPLVHGPQAGMVTVTLITGSGNGGHVFALHLHGST